MKRNYLFMLAGFFIISCANDNNELPNSNPSNQPIKVTAGISQSRATDTQWEIGDKIGISMECTNLTYNNIPYTTSEGDGIFTAIGEQIYFPEEMETTHFYAYYPYSNSVSSSVYSFDIDGNTDVMWANASIDADVTETNVNFSFQHKLSKIVLKLSEFPVDTKVTISNQPTKGSLDLNTGEVTANNATEKLDIEFIQSEVNKSEYTAILMPATGYERTLTISSVSDAKEWTYTFTSETNHQSGYKYTYLIENNGKGTPVEVTCSDDGIQDWTTEDDKNLEVTESPHTTWKKYLVGKTFVPDVNYFYDFASIENGADGWTNQDGTAFGDNFNDDWKWSSDLKNMCENSSITFYEEDGLIKANSSDNGTAKTGISVIIDYDNYSLTFSEPPFTFNWQFSENFGGFYDKSGNNLGTGGCGPWLLFGLNKDTYGDFDVKSEISEISDLFDNGMHWAYTEIDGENMVYRVVNFVEGTVEVQ